MGPPSPDLGFATESNTQVSGTLAITLLTVGLLNVTLSVGKATGTLTQADCNDGSPEDIHVGTTFQNVVLTVTSAAGVSGTITLPSNPVADKTLNYPTNFAPAPPGTVVTASSSLGAPTFSGNAAFMLLQAVLSPLLSTLLTGPVGVDALLSGLGVTVGNADYLGLGMTCGVPKLVQ
jgi:uncharacterized membrane protein